LTGGEPAGPVPCRRAPKGLSTGETGKERTMDKYVCTLCGYVYDPEQGDPDNDVAAGTRWEDVPEDWECPVCGASKEDFEKEE